MTACATPPKPPWSAKLHRASLTYRYWKSVASSKTNNTTISDALTTIQKQLAIPSTTTTLHDILYNTKKAKQRLKEIRNNAKQERQIFLQQHRERIAQQKYHHVSHLKKAIQCLDRQIWDKNSFKRIKHTFAKRATAPIKRVQTWHESEHIDPETGKKIYKNKNNNKIVNNPTPIILSTKADVEKIILQRNKHHFAKAKETPWHQPPLQYVNSANNFDVHSCHNLPHDNHFIETSTILQILQDEYTKNHPLWSPDVSFQAFLKGLNNWNEQTSTSPSGRHLGTYKALLVAYYNSTGNYSSPTTSTDKISTQQKSQDILQLVHCLASIAASHGFFLSRWTQVINVMIYKKTDSIDIEQHRVIHLFEADFNLMLGILFGRRSSYHQAHHHLLHPGQYARPGGECQDAAFAKILHYHTSNYTKTI